MPQRAPDSADGGPADGPTITYADVPTPEARAIVEWAIGRFTDAGLQLPDLVISFPAYCRGKGALYHVGQGAIDFCQLNRRVALHELAHAWDDTSGEVDREEFMQLRGVQLWFGGIETPSAEQGSEHLAVIIAWGLMDAGARSAHGLPHNSDAELSAAFETLTGSQPG